MSASLTDVNLPDNDKILVDATNPNIGDFSIHTGALMAGFGQGKQTLTASYKPQSGIQGDIRNSQFDILVPPTIRNTGINIVDNVFLQIDIKLSSPSGGNEVTLKPVHQWFNRVEISQDGSNQIQIIYFDFNYAKMVMDSNISNLDDIKAQINMDPRNFLAWFDAKSSTVEFQTDALGAITDVRSVAGRSAYLSQPYFQTVGTYTGAAQAGVPYSYTAVAKGGTLSTDINCGIYTFYLPIPNTFLQSAKVLLNKISSNIRFRFYMNNEVKLYDSGSNVNITQVNIQQATLWLTGSKLSDQGLNVMDAKYLNPVVGASNYYLEFTQTFQNPSLTGFNEAVLSPLTGLASSLLFWIEDTRPDIRYPPQSPGGERYINNNMMTLPIKSYQFVQDNGSIYGSGDYIGNDLILMINSFRKFPVSTYQDDRLYFKKFYSIDFNNNPVTVANEAAYGGLYALTGRERIRFQLFNAADFPANVFPNRELNNTGNEVTTVPASAIYSNITLHVVATIKQEIIESNGLIAMNLPRNF